MSDARRRDHAASEHEGPEPPVAPADQADHPGPEALGAWPSGDEEASAMPAEAAVDDASAGTAAGDEHDTEDASAASDGQPAGGEDSRSREELLTALADLQHERDDYLDGMRRARAEFENYRKRTMREGASQREAGRAEVAETLLEVLDDLDRTLEAADASSDDGLAKGVQLVAEKLVAALRAAGLERVDATGVAFDPHLHEAVQQVAADPQRDEPVVTQVLRPGYALGERVLRAAMVVVEQ